MVFYCCVYGCKGSGFDEGVSMHGFPTDEKRKKVSFTYNTLYFLTKHCSKYCTFYFHFSSNLACYILVKEKGVNIN